MAAAAADPISAGIGEDAAGAGVGISELTTLLLMPRERIDRERAQPRMRCGVI
jgi:hypothetical protein